MKESEVKWIDIDQSRNMLLSKSDWTQIMDTSLIPPCVRDWQVWRAEVREVNDRNYSERIPAVLELKRLKDNQPPNRYDIKKHTHTHESFLDLTEIARQVYALGIEPSSESSQEPNLDNITSMSEARKYAETALERARVEKIKDVSPQLESIHLYLERLNESISCISGEGVSYPLLSVVADSLDEPVESVAKTVLSNHIATINKFAVIEKSYILALKQLKNSGTIGELKIALETF